MAKNLASKLRTGAMVGLAALAVSAPMKAKADLSIPYTSGTIGVTNHVSYLDTNNVPREGNLIISYDQTIQEVDTNGDSIMDSYLSTLNVRNDTTDINETDGAFFLMNINADLAGRGATGLTNYWASAGNTWHWENTGSDKGRYLLDAEMIAMQPNLDDTFYYTIPTNQVIGWENVNAQMGANAGAVSFGFQAPKAIPEPTTMGALLTGAVALLAGRRIRDKYKY